MSRKVFAGALAAFVLGTGVCGAAVVSVPELPQFEMTRAPTHPPASVSAGAHVKGLFVGRSRANLPKIRQVQLFDAAPDAAEFASKGMVARDARTRRPCAYVADSEELFGEAWPSVSMDTIAFFQGSGRPPVMAVHIETVEGEWTKERGGAVDMVDGWLDVRSGGLKLIQRSTMQVKQIAEGPFGVRVFASKGTETVHFVVLPPSLASGVPESAVDFERAIIQEGGEVGGSECRHARLTLEAKPGAGAHAIVSYQHVNGGPPGVSRDDVDDVPGELGTFDTSTFQLLQVHLSASKNTKGTEPIVSVGFHVDAPQTVL